MKRTEPSVVSFFEDKISLELKKLFPERGGLVHRLDKDTSGILILAKNRLALESIQAQFKAHLVKKEYLAIVHGVVLEPGIIKLPIGRKNVGTMTTSAYAGKIAETRFSPIKAYADFTLLKVIPKTGRTHQIRVHLAALSHPILGDRLYGRSKDRKLVSRMFLHASRIVFKDVTSDKIIDLTSSPKNFNPPVDLSNK